MLEKKIFRTYFVYDTMSLFSVFKEIIKRDHVEATIIFNNPLENAFAIKGINAGICTAYYSSGIWRNHVTYRIIQNERLHVGTINVENNTLDNIFTSALKSDLSNIVQMKQFSSNMITIAANANSNIEIHFDTPAGYKYLGVLDAWIDSQYTFTTNHYQTGSGIVLAYARNTNSIEIECHIYISILFLKQF